MHGIFYNGPRAVSDRMPSNSASRRTFADESPFTHAHINQRDDAPCWLMCHAKRWSRPVSRVLYVLRRDSHSSRPGVAAWLQQPTREQRGPRYRSPIWSCSEWGLPCRTALAPYAVRSYRTLSPLPVPLRAIGGLLSVALAVSSRCPGVTWHSALWSPDFPRCAYRATRLSGRLHVQSSRSAPCTRCLFLPMSSPKASRTGCAPTPRRAPCAARR